MLVDYQIESKGVTALAEGLKNSECLESIDLYQNQIGSFTTFKVLLHSCIIREMYS